MTRSETTSKILTRPPCLPSTSPILALPQEDHREKTTRLIIILLFPVRRFFLWSSRCRGKGLYLLPEQFTREWEYRAAIDLANLAMSTTAGKYSWWSNLYQIGWIMWSLITHCFPPAPPRALPYAYASEVIGVAEDSHGFTYGMHVMAEDFTWCDVELRRQILRCLDHDPTKRPRLIWLEAVFLHNVRRPDLVQVESDEQLRAHMNDIYGGPVQST